MDASKWTLDVIVTIVTKGTLRVTIDCTISKYWFSDNFIFRFPLVQFVPQVKELILSYQYVKPF